MIVPGVKRVAASVSDSVCVCVFGAGIVHHSRDLDHLLILGQSNRSTK